MSGNRVKLKNGWLSVALLFSSSLLFGLETAHIERLDLLTKNINRLMHAVCDKKSNETRDDIVKALEGDLIVPSKALAQTIPNVPPVSGMLKRIVEDLLKSLETMHQTLSKSSNFAMVKTQLGGNPLLKEMLEKAADDLDQLITYAKIHPDVCSTETLEALKKYRTTTFKQCYDEWYPKTNSYFMQALNLIFWRSKK